MIRALVVAAASFEVGTIDDEWDAALTRANQFAPLPVLPPAVRELGRALSRIDGVELVGGKPLENPNLDTVQQEWRRLHQGPSTALIVHVAGHGVSRGPALYLPVMGTDSMRLPATAINIVQWLDEVEHTEDASPTLFLLDVCEAGNAALYQIIQRIRDHDRKAWVIAACAPDEMAFGARFTTAFAAVLDRLRNGRLDISPLRQYVPVETIAKEVDRELSRHSGPQDYAQTVVRTTRLAATAPVPPFFINPLYTEDPNEQLRHRLDAALWEMAEEAVPGLDPVHFLTRASGMPQRIAALGACFFTGRTDELGFIRAWLEGDNARRLLVVTGSPGAGKSALLGVTTCLSHPQLLPLSNAVRSRIRAGLRPTGCRQSFAAVHSRFRSTGEVIASIAAQLGLDPLANGAEWTVDELAKRLARLSQPAIVVIDAVDEALNGGELVDRLILPLIEKSRGTGEPLCRIAVGIRPWWDQFDRLRFAAESQGVLVDLDSSTPPGQLGRDLAAYVADLLSAAPGYASADWQAVVQAVGDRLAHMVNGRFLLASLFADYLARTSPLSAEQAIERLPSDLPGMFRLQLESTRTPWLLPTLTVVAQGKGKGMPLNLIHTAVQAIIGDSDSPTVDDVRDVLTEVVFYLRTDTDTDGRLLYRFFHQSLVEHFLDGQHEVPIMDYLLESVPAEGSLRVWHHASPYLLRHALDHAADVGNAAVDSLLLDPAFLLHAEPDGVLRHLSRATSVTARRHASIYASASPYLKEDDMERRRQLLVFDAVRQQHAALARCLWHVPTNAGRPPLVPRWATGPSTAPNLVLTLDLHTVDEVTALAVGQSEEVPVVLIGGRNGAVDMHEAIDGAPLHSFTGHSGPVSAIGTVNLNGLMIAISGSDDGMLCLWDLADGTLIARHDDPENGVTALCVKEIDGFPVAFVSTKTSVLHVISLPDAERLDTYSGFPLDINAIDAMVDGDQLRVDMLRAADYETDEGLTTWTLGRLNGRSVEVLGYDDGSVEVWERDGDGALLHVLQGYEGFVAIAETSRWPDASGPPSRVYVVGFHDRTVSAVTAGPMKGTPVVVSAHGDGIVRIWDVAYRSLVGYRSTEKITSAMTCLGDRDVLITEQASHRATVWDNERKAFETRRIDRQVRIWDAVDGLENPNFGNHDHTVNTAACTTLNGRPVVVTAETTSVIQVRDVASGDVLRELTGHEGDVNAVACTVLDGQPVAVSAGNDHTVRVWDLVTAQQLRILIGHHGPVRSVACGTTDRCSVIISGGTDATIRVWEAATGDPVGCPVHLPANKPFNVGLAVKDTSVAIYFGGEVAMFGCAGESSLTIGEPTEIPLLRVSHVINWFPGGLLADDPDADHWGLHSVEEWQRSGPAAEPKSGLAAPIDVSPARLARWAAGLLDKAGLDVVELEHGFYGVSLTEDFADGHEFPAFFVITHARPFPTTQEKTQ